MKSIITILTSIAIFLTSFTSHAKESSEYFICEFNDSISTTDIQRLKTEGFQIVETDNQRKVIYVKSKNHANFSSHLEARMREVIKVDKNGEKTYVIEAKSASPEFVKIFFNFI